MVFCRRIDSEKAESFDVNKLIETRLLIQANSGGGKSYAVRKLLEETYGKSQQIVLDMEGEFATLREKYDYLLVGKNGDIPASPKTAEVLARKLLELKVSAIIDLYELQAHERIRFVKLFLDAMINAPKELWHPVLIVIDEAHVFCPEKDQAESAGSVKDIMTRGRKRGYCGILTTQRISKLAKDAAAECNNKLIGRSGLDIDMKRAAEELGFTTQEERHSLRNLPPGVFYAFGPAISEDVHQVKVQPVSTVHPKIGYRNLAELIPPARPLVLKALEGLKDLPKVAEKDALDKDALRKRVRELEQELRKAPAPKVDDTKVTRLGQLLDEEKARNRQLLSSFKAAEAHQRTLSAGIGRILNVINSLPDDKQYADTAKEAASHAPVRPVTLARPAPVAARPIQPAAEAVDGSVFGRCERAILRFLAMREGTSFTKQQIGVMTGYSHGSGGFNNSMSRLKVQGLVTQSSDKYAIASARVSEVTEILGSDYVALSTEGLEEWLNKLGKCAKELYRKLLENPGRVFTKEELGSETGYAPSSGGFNNSISQLCTLGLAERIDGGVRLNEAIQNL